MHRVTLILTFLFSLMFSSPSYSEWTRVDENVEGDTFYVDYERIRKVDGYVYWWDMKDYLKPSPYSHLSGKIYHQGDCKLFRYKNLTFVQHKQPMGRGSQDSEFDYSPKNPEWNYLSPDSVGETVLKTVCSR